MNNWIRSPTLSFVRFFWLFKNTPMTEKKSLQVREMVPDDIGYYVTYWIESSDKHMHSMGVDIAKRPTRKQLESFINDQLRLPIKKRTSYFLIWLVNNNPIGYSNVNQIEFGKKAYMHLHLWHTENRQKGIGTEFVKKSLPFFFGNLKLQQLFCEPYSLNIAPNKTVEKVGFEFVKQHLTIPGASNFEQLVNQWMLTKKKYEELMLN